MSVLVEGSVEQGCWNGVWQFVRDRSAKVRFSYVRKGSALPNELIDYVSFSSHTTRDVKTENGEMLPVPVVRAKSRGRLPNKAPKSALLPIKLEVSPAVEVAAAAAIEVPVEVSSDRMDVSGNSDHSNASEDTDSFRLPCVHPLCGLWEGSFDIKSVVGGADSAVPEI